MSIQKLAEGDSYCDTEVTSSLEPSQHLSKRLVSMPKHYSLKKLNRKEYIIPGKLPSVEEVDHFCHESAYSTLTKTPIKVGTDSNRIPQLNKSASQAPR